MRIFPRVVCSKTKNGNTGSPVSLLFYQYFQWSVAFNFRVLRRVCTQSKSVEESFESPQIYDQNTSSNSSLIKDQADYLWTQLNDRSYIVRHVWKYLILETSYVDKPNIKSVNLCVVLENVNRTRMNGLFVRLKTVVSRLKSYLAAQIIRTQQWVCTAFILRLRCDYLRFHVIKQLVSFSFSNYLLNFTITAHSLSVTLQMSITPHHLSVLYENKASCCHRNIPIILAGFFTLVRTVLVVGWNMSYIVFLIPNCS